MFKDVSEVKEFIIWARSQKIQALKVGEVEVHFGTAALIDTETLMQDARAELEAPTLTDEQIKALKKEELDLLFHSST